MAPHHPHPRPAPPPVHQTAELKVLASQFERWNQALQTGDPEIVASMYAPDGVLLPTVSNQVRTDHAGKVRARQRAGASWAWACAGACAAWLCEQNRTEWLRPGASAEDASVLGRVLCSLTSSHSRSVPLLCPILRPPRRLTTSRPSCS